MVRGPFFQTSPSSVDIQSGGFVGSFARIFTASSQWQKQVRLETGPLLGASSPGEPDISVGALKYERIASIVNSVGCTQSFKFLADPSGLAGSSSASLAPKESLSILTGLIGNVSREREPENSLKISAMIFGSSLIQNHSITNVPKWFQAESYVHSCLSWNALEALAINNAKASTTGTTDIQLVSSLQASEVVCYISGLSGEWARTTADGTHPGASLQPYAQVYAGLGNDIRLKVFSPTGAEVGAYASCLNVDP